MSAGNGTASYCGSSKERQEIGLPGHCDNCAAVGHVAAHPDLGCADVGCYSAHDEDPPGVYTTPQLEREPGRLITIMAARWEDDPVDGDLTTMPRSALTPTTEREQYFVRLLAARVELASRRLSDSGPEGERALRGSAAGRPLTGSIGAGRRPGDAPSWILGPATTPTWQRRCPVCDHIWTMPLESTHAVCTGGKSGPAHRQEPRLLLRWDISHGGPA